MSLPYRHDLLIRVTVVDDGIHADGHGAMATARKLAALIPGLDEHVIDCSAFPADIAYLGKNDVEVPDPADRGTFRNPRANPCTHGLLYGCEICDTPSGFDSAGGVA